MGAKTLDDDPDVIPLGKEQNESVKRQSIRIATQVKGKEDFAVDQVNQGTLENERQLARVIY